MSKSDGLEDDLTNATKHVIEQVHEAKETLRTLDQRVLGFVKERPGTCIVAALATGFVLGRMGRTQVVRASTSATRSVFAAGLSTVLRAAAIALINDRIGAMMRSGE